MHNKLQLYFQKQLRRILGFYKFLILLKKERNTAIVINWTHIGDMCYTFSYLKEFMARNNITSCALPSTGYNSQIIKYYPISGVHIFYVKSDAYINDINIFLMTDLGRQIYKYLFKRKRIVNLMYRFYMPAIQLFKYPSLNWLDLIKYSAYQICGECKPQYPQITACNIEDIVTKNNIRKGKTIILNPYASSMNMIPAECWADIAAYIRKKGYLAVTTLSDTSQQPVLGTKGIITDLAESYFLAEFCGYVIGVRSGWMDFIISSKSRKICIYNHYNDEYVLENIWSLKAWGDNDITELSYDSKSMSAEDIVTKVIQHWGI